jgi:hypothetical protein
MEVIGGRPEQMGAPASAGGITTPAYCEKLR